jgi:hypothetical protein
MFNRLRWGIASALRTAEKTISNDNTDFAKIFRTARYYIPFMPTPVNVFKYDDFEKKIRSEVQYKNTAHEITIEEKKEIIENLILMKKATSKHWYIRYLYKRNLMIRDKYLDYSDMHTFYGTISRAAIMMGAAMCCSADFDLVSAGFIGGCYIAMKIIFFAEAPSTDTELCDRVDSIYGILQRQSDSRYGDWLKNEFGIASDAIGTKNNIERILDSHEFGVDLDHQSDSRDNRDNNTHKSLYPKNTYDDGKGRCCELH